MASKIDMVSNALILIGDQPVNSLDGNDRRQVVANNLYKSIKETELSKTRWGFARRKAVLAKTTGTPEDDEFDSIYQLPTDMLVLIKTKPTTNYRIYGDKMYCNIDTNTTFSIDYVANVSESEFPPYFVDVMQYALARNFATSIRDSAAARQEMTTEYLNATRVAYAVDAQQYPMDEIQHHPFIEVRN